MSEWIEYTGSDEQLKELLTTKSKFMVDNKWSVFHKPTTLNMPATEDNLNWLAALLRDTKVKNYLICQPHQYADLIKIWADTGCPVWVRPTKPYEFEISDYENHPTTKLMVDHRGVYLITTAPDWNIPGEYRLTPFED